MSLGGAYGGGVQFQLFTQSNGASGIYATIAARDVYFGANPTDLARLNDDPNTVIKVLDDGTGNLVYQHRVGGAWLDTTAVIQGETGGAANFAAVSPMHIPAKAANNIDFIDSGAQVLPSTGIVRFGNSIEVPSGSIEIGTILAASEATSFALLDSKLATRDFSILDSRFDAAGSSIPRYFKLQAVQTVNTQPVDTTVITANPLNFFVITAFLAQTNIIKFKTNGAMTNVRIRITDNTTGEVIKYLPNRNAWDTSTNGFSFISGLNTINMLSKAADSPGVFNVGKTPFRLNQSVQIDVTVEADAVNLLGNASNVPFLDLDIQQATEQDMVEGVDFGTPSIANHIATFTDVNGNKLGMSEDAILRSSGGSGSPSLVLENSAGLGRLQMFYLEGSNRSEILATDNLVINSQLEISADGDNIVITANGAADTSDITFKNSVGATKGTLLTNHSTSFFEMLTSDYRISLHSTTESINLTTDGGNKSIAFIATNAADTQPGFLFQQGGTNGGTSQVFVGTRNPEGFVTGDGGALYIRDDGTSSNLYIKTADASNTGWNEIGIGGDVDGPAGSTDSRIALFSGVTGKLLKDTSDITITAVNEITGATEVHLKSSSATGFISLETLAHNDTIATAKMTSSSASTSFFVGTQDPEGVVTADPGSLYIRANGTNSSIFILESAGTANTPWENILSAASGGNVDGPAVSVDGHLVAFDGVTGKLLKQVSDVFVRATSGTDDPVIEIQDSVGTPELVLSADFSSGNNALVSQSLLEITTGSQLLRLKAAVAGMAWDCSNVALSGQVMTIDNITAGVGKLQFKDATNERGFIGYDVSANAIVVDSKDPGNTSTIIKSDNSVTIENSNVSGFIALVSTGSSDLTEVFLAQNTGTNPGQVDFHVGNRDPNGNVNQNEGTVYFRESGATSAIYLKTSPLASATGWQELLHTGSGASGDVDGPSSSIDGHLVSFDGTTGKLIKQVEDVVLQASGVNSTSRLDFKNSVGTVVGSLLADNNVSDMEITTSYNLILFSTNSRGVELLTQNVAASLLMQNISTPDTVRNTRFFQGGTNGGTMDLHVGSRTPLGNVTANGGSLYIRDSVTSSELYFKKSDASNTEWHEAVLKNDASTTTGQFAIWDGTSSTVNGSDQWTLIGNAIISEAASPVTSTRLIYQNSSGTPIASIDANNNTSELVLSTPTTYNIELNCTDGNIRLITQAATNRLIIDHAALPDTLPGIEFIQGGANGGRSDIFVGNRTPESVVTGSGGNIYIRDDAANSEIYLKRSSTTNMNEWSRLKHEQDNAIASINRVIGAPIASQSLSNSVKKCNAFDSNGFTTGGELVADQANNHIQIANIIDTTNGDLYQVDCNIGVNGTQLAVVNIGIITSDGLGITFTPVFVAERFFGNSADTNAISLSGLVRGPSSITGTGFIGLGFVVAAGTTGTIYWHSLNLNARRI